MVDDLYRLFKCQKEQPIMAENLQNVLLIISGERNTGIELPLEGDRALNWAECGNYDE